MKRKNKKIKSLEKILDIHVIKRKGKMELFDERKVYASCFAACKSVPLHDTEAEKICDSVARDIKKWIRRKKQINSNQLFRQIAKTIRKYNNKAAFMYETHRDIG